MCHAYAGTILINIIGYTINQKVVGISGKGYCGNDPQAPKFREQLDLSSSGKYGVMVANCEAFAKPTKSGKAKADPGYDEVTKKIGADKDMKKADRIAILGMKDILEGTDEKGKEE